MIEGVGIDLVEINRFKRILQGDSGERFLERVLTPAERELAGRRSGRLPEFAAGRFAAKEAVVKAIGCGIGRSVGFQDIEVLPDEHGKPVCTVSDAAWTRLARKGAASSGKPRIHLSITHTETTAAAYAIIERV